MDGPTLIIEKASLLKVFVNCGKLKFLPFFSVFNTNLKTFVMRTLIWILWYLYLKILLSQLYCNQEILNCQFFSSSYFKNRRGIKVFQDLDKDIQHKYIFSAVLVNKLKLGGWFVVQKYNWVKTPFFLYLKHFSFPVLMLFNEARLLFINKLFNKSSWSHMSS